MREREREKASFNSLNLFSMDLRVDEQEATEEVRKEKPQVTKVPQQGQKNGQKNKIRRGDNGGKKQTRENLSQVLDVGVNEQKAFEGGLEVRGESHHCVPHAHRIDGSNSQRAVAM